MKLLGWMHNKIWQSGIEPIKDFTFANPCICLSVQTTVNDEDIYLKPSFGSRALQLHNRDCEKSSSEVEANNVLETSEDISASFDFFHGFLTIGTLGSEPATPTFSMAFENMIEMPNEVTENDLKLINYEIEKFLEAETKEDWCESPGRTSHASIITLAGKHVEGTEDDNGGKTLTCPLQGYLFGSTVELPDKMTDVRKEKTSSAELFQNTLTTNEISKGNIEKIEVQVKHSNKSALRFVKKMLKKLRTSSHGSSNTEACSSYSTKKKLQKVLRLFCRKIHPESTTAANECQNSFKHNFKNYSSANNYNIGSMTNRAEDQINFCQESISKEDIHYWKTNMGLPLYGEGSNVSRANKGHWIKTDADYLVLEL